MTVTTMLGGEAPGRSGPGRERRAVAASSALRFTADPGGSAPSESQP
jgi:hypothetical protein